MKIYDITQEIFGCRVYPGDTGPAKAEEKRMARGDLYNLSSFSMGAHNGTHIDAPFHFYLDGDTVEQIPPEKTIGPCYVSLQEEEIGEEQAREILRLAALENPEAARRILIKGSGVVTEQAARVFAQAGVYLLGAEGQSVGPEDAPMAVHKILLGAKTVLLEGVRLAQADEGVYFLCAAPLLLAGLDGAPCRAFLIRE